MKTIVRVLVVLLILVGIAGAAYRPVRDYWGRRNQTVWRTAKVQRGSIVAVVNSTGTVKPKLQVSIGSFVSGPIQELYCEFNQEVKKGDLLAKIDPRIYQASVTRDRALLANREADVLRVDAQLQQAINDEKRTIALRTKNESYIAAAELDKAKFARMGLDAQLKVARTLVEEAKGTLETSLANLNYTEIRSPVDGIVINRKIDPGQTVAAQFQTPELFIVALDMRKEMHVHASVDEADIGLIKEAQSKNYAANFTVDAYPEKVFTGTIREIRLSSTTTQNVVTYPVVVAASNPQLELLPGMTASLSFRTSERADVVKIPNAALRFYPMPKDVRPQDLHLLDTSDEAQQVTADEHRRNVEALSADERSRLRRDHVRRHVWVIDENLLRAVEVVTGLTDGTFTEMVSGDLKPDDLLVTGIHLAKLDAAR